MTRFSRKTASANAIPSPETKSPISSPVSPIQTLSKSVSVQILSPQALELAANYDLINSPDVKSKIFDLVKHLSNS